MDPNAALDRYASGPRLEPTEPAYRLIAALLDPAVRAFVNGQPKGGLELHWDAEKPTVVVTTRHTSRYVLKLHPVAPR